MTLFISLSDMLNWGLSAAGGAGRRAAMGGDVAAGASPGGHRVEIINRFSSHVAVSDHMDGKVPRGAAIESTPRCSSI